MRTARLAGLAVLLCAASLSAETAATVWSTDPWTPGVLLSPRPAALPDASQQAPSNVLRMDFAKLDQTVDGFGASLTESAAWAIQSLPPAARDALMEEFFSPGKGLNLSFLRQPMGAPDFARSIYSYDDVAAGETDFPLAKFSLERDKASILPLLKQARALAPALKILASPWSPPAWMKTGASMLGASGGVLRSDAYAAYANYFVRFLKGYQQEGVDVFAVTPQNEPAYGPPQYPGMVWSAAEEGRFIREYLGPALAQNAPGVLILGWDHNYDRPDYAQTLLSDPKTARWLAGTAWHDYGGSAQAMGDIRKSFPGKDVWMTEGGLGTWISGGSFRAQFKFGIQQGMGALQNGARSFVLWNLALDSHNGPMVFPNTANEGLVKIDTDSGTVTARNAGYWVLAQFSRFIQPGARRVLLPAGPSDVDAVAFSNPDGTAVLVLGNRFLSEQTVRVVQGPHTWDVTVPAEGASTIVWKP